ncbi:unnamed protein product [Clonostachys chloroleuca]|uniref:Uncharacterized protein n=1 Tax=Clonostachys chloroleuca TaxID=1926264 RepID=A0AA35PYJ6_9HYPO|nr:unnamed protein product [Clonostachys chloroleuca]
MASFSRGLLWHSLRPLSSPRILLSELSAPRAAARLLTTSPCLHAATSSPAKTSRPPPPPPRPSQRGQPPKPSGLTNYALIKTLATKPTPTVLYEGASHFWFYFGCWTSGITILAWTCLTAPSVVSQPEGVPSWVSWVYGASYALLTGMGFFLISKTPNIVSSIRVLPAAAAKSAPANVPAAARRAPSAPSAAAPTMEVTVQRMVPLLQPKVLRVPLDKVSLKSRLSLPDEYVPELRRKELARRAEQEQVALRRFDMEHLLTMPFRRMGRALKALFRGVRSAWTDMGWGVMTVDGKNYKVNVEKGFAHDGFRTLERIVPIDPK